ncbi:histidine kinase [Rhizocola hellebori]|uniref:histidine kinase n=1 Tax=Rhizocola hellebori TaxID=1392758 RepID=A0A8J3QFJ6_9ACTN|nr:sensor histidine kinase [Rhizocola hellebori]GIH10008.1 histidine kinase [Rhizocola hellebori]
MHRILYAPFSRRAWRELAYVWASLPLAVFGLVGVYGMFSPIVPPSIAVTLWMARWWGRVYRRLARTVLHIDIEAPERGPRPAEPGPIAWILAQIGHGASWRAAAYAFLRLPYGILMVGVGAGFWLCAAAGIASPLLGNVIVGYSLAPAWLAFAIGLVLLFVAPWVVHGLVRLDLYLMGRLLGRRLLRERVRDLEQTRALAVDNAAATLRRIERDLHDGAGVRLVALAMDLAMLRDRLRQETPDLAIARELAEAAHTHAKEAIGELRDLARGIHPPVLDRGLTEALQSLAARSPVPVVVNVALPRRPAPAIETIAYFCASELVANVARHSQARQAKVDVVERDGGWELQVSDDGIGGAAANANGGTGLSGLADRVRPVDGTLTVSSPVGGPTVVTVRLPWHA